MKYYGQACVADFLGDALVFRNLRPLDTSLPALDELRESLNIPAPELPRKTSLNYARVIHHMLNSMRPDGFERLIYVGDTQFNDGSAFHNLCSVSGWQGAAFICAEKPQQPACLHWKPAANTRFFTANRWALLPAFRNILGRQNFLIDQNCAVVVDLDKTTLGARGRNDTVIDAARLAAALATANDVFNALNQAQFTDLYNQLNQTDYHAITADNQDFLVYLCLVITDGLLSLEEIQAGMANKTMQSFQDLANRITQRASCFSPPMAKIHRSFTDHLNAGDPTPFKQFRQNEYRNTIEALKYETPPASMDELLATKIVITAEVMDFARYCTAQGAALLAISDKPDEASLPSAALKAQGFLPIHRVPANVVGH